MTHTSQTAPYRGTEYSSPKEYAQPGPTGNLDRAHSVRLDSEIPWPSSKQDSSRRSEEVEVGGMA